MADINPAARVTFAEAWAIASGGDSYYHRRLIAFVEQSEARITALELALATARRQAFEEAAAACDGFADGCDDTNHKLAAFGARGCAKAIRTLITNPPGVGS